MLKSPRSAQFFRQLTVFDGLRTAPSRRINTNQLPIRSNLQQRTFSAIRSPIWNRPRVQPFQRSSLPRGIRNVRRNGTRASPGEQASSGKPLSLSDRMKQMSKKYGWTVVGIYLGLSVLDFPFCFLAVRLFGTERIGHVEHVLIDGFWSLLESVIPSLKDRRARNEVQAEAERLAELEKNPPPELDAKQKGERASIWTQLLIAYGVHKSLIFFRIPITLAITPKVVKVLRGWGWKIGNTASKTV